MVKNLLCNAVALLMLVGVASCASAGAQINKCWPSQSAQANYPLCEPNRSTSKGYHQEQAEKKARAEASSVGGTESKNKGSNE
jgi:hypothetical protein